MAYASPDDYAARYDGGTVTQAQLDRAALAVDAMLIGSVYDADSETTKAALRDATCAQAHATDPQAAAASLADQVRTATIGRASYTLQDSVKAPALDSQGRSTEARQVLAVAGLLPVMPYVWG